MNNVFIICEKFFGLGDVVMYDFVVFFFKENVMFFFNLIFILKIEMMLLKIKIF